MTNLEQLQAYHALESAGILADPPPVPRGARNLTDAELEVIGRVPPGTPTTTQIIDEDRSSYDERLRALEEQLTELKHQLWALQDWRREQTGGK